MRQYEIILSVQPHLCHLVHPVERATEVVEEGVVAVHERQRHGAHELLAPRMELQVRRQKPLYSKKQFLAQRFLF